MKKVLILITIAVIMVIGLNQKANAQEQTKYYILLNVENAFLYSLILILHLDILAIFLLQLGQMVVNQ